MSQPGSGLQMRPRRRPRAARGLITTPPITTLMCLFVVIAGVVGTPEVLRGTQTVDTLPGGVVHVLHSALPPPTGTLVPDLVIGAIDGEESELFAYPVGLQVANDGTIYVLDGAQFGIGELRAYGPDGSYLATLTREGGGPGELANPNGVLLRDDGTLWVNDVSHGRIIGLSADGREVERYPLLVPGDVLAFTWSGTIDREGKIWQPSIKSGSPGPPRSGGLREVTNRLYLKQLDTRSGSVDSLYVGDFPATDYVVLQGPNEPWGFAPLRYQSAPMIAMDPAGGFWTAMSGTYRLVRLNAAGDTALIVEVAERGPPLSSEEREEALSASRRHGSAVMDDVAELLPDRKPVLERIFVDDERRLWVRRARRQGEPPLFDVFNPAGEHLGSLAGDPMLTKSFGSVIHRGSLYTIAAGEWDVPLVMRARLPELSSSPGAQQD